MLGLIWWFSILVWVGENFVEKWNSGGDLLVGLYVEKFCGVVAGNYKGVW